MFRIMAIGLAILLSASQSTPAAATESCLHTLQNWFGRSTNQPGDDDTFRAFKYEYGCDSSRDMDAAIRYYRKAVEVENSKAMMMLAILYAVVGADKYRNMKEYRRLMESAAERGEVDAAYWLATDYVSGRDNLPKDDTAAFKWMREAAKDGMGSANEDVGEMYYYGRGTPQNFRLAADSFLKGAEWGDGKAQFILGLMYWNGKGVPQNLVQAHKWLNLAASVGMFHLGEYETTADAISMAIGSGDWKVDYPYTREKAAALRDRLAGLMTPDQLSEAQRLASEWRPVHASGGATPPPRNLRSRKLGHSPPL